MEDGGGGGWRALKLRARLGLNREVFARLIPVSTRSLAKQGFARWRRTVAPSEL